MEAARGGDEEEQSGEKGTEEGKRKEERWQDVGERRNGYVGGAKKGNKSN